MQVQRWTRRPRQSTLTLSPDVTMARARAVSWAMTALADERTVFLDTETTGFGPEAEIVDIAVVAADGRVLLDTLVRAERPIPAGASAVHRLYAADLIGAPTWIDLLPTVTRLLTDRTVVVYNADFDRQMVEYCCARSGAFVPVARWECAMKAYAEYRAETNPKTRQFRWHKLEHAAVHCGLAPGGHRARGDAEACRLVVRRMAAG